MKISEFARKYNAEISTVRYYINSGLLFPKVRNKQYRFDERCETDMNIIVQLKDYGFSISEIRSILYLIHLTNLTALDDVSVFIQILEEKETELHTELKSLQKTHNDLLSFIDSLKGRLEKDSISAPGKGMPLSMLPLLCCPDCGQTLQLQKADIADGRIINGEAECICGYHATIRDGILITETGTINSLDIPYLNRGIFKLLPDSWVSMFRLSFDKMDEMMKPKWDENGTYSGGDFFRSAADFLNLSIADALVSEDYIVKILAILDKRVGKRTLEKIRDTGEYQNYPDWVRQFYELRLSL